MSSTLYFENPDFLLPPFVTPDWCVSRITSAEFGENLRGDRQLLVTHSVSGITPACGRVTEIFALDGRPHAVRLARRRLVYLYHACGLFPQEGDEIAPEDLRKAQLEVQVEYGHYLGRPQLQVIAYRPYSHSQAFTFSN